jgi:DNA-binding LytR/AlgR family response regulator
MIPVADIDCLRAGEKYTTVAWHDAGSLHLRRRSEVLPVSRGFLPRVRQM